MSTLNATALVIGYLVLGAASLVVTLYALSWVNMVVVLAATWRMRNPDSPFPRKPLRAPWKIWHLRWQKCNGFTLRANRHLAGYERDVQTMGLGAYLAGDAYRREDFA